MDDADHAEEIIQLTNGASIRSIRTRARAMSGLSDNAIKTRLHYADAEAEACIDCGEEIPAKRLENVPGTKRCLSCQRIAEQVAS